ncbi:helix-loop-helix DNA-binding domain-containing protein [Mycena latifolia]|nr:helix-loop-helix DNA-binding domain-containing protein [Mycena latifolia]
MSAFALEASSPAYKPVRQEGFHLPSPPPHTTDTPPPLNHPHPDAHNLFLTGGMGHGFHGAGGGMDFNDELASLINPQSNERSTQSPSGFDAGKGGNGAFDNGNGGEYRPPPHTHNIFDISAPHAHHHQAQHHHGSASSTGSSFPAHFSLPSSNNNNNNNNNSNNGNNNGSGASNGGGSSPGSLADGAPPYHFNSTLPALNSSMRYDPHPHPHAHAGYMPSPSSFRSPSPHGHASRSRSRSRPPSAHLASTPAGGPTRTTRARRNGSLSSTSPPPRPVPQAIVIPGSHGQNRGSPYWFGVNGDQAYPHATPDSLPSLTSLPSLPSLNSLHSPLGSVNGSINGNGVSANGNGSSTNGSGAGEGKGDSKATLLAHEKRRRRRESHNAVERRRRDNINEKISELATLIPECLLEGGAQTSAQGQSPGSPDDALLSPTTGGAGAGDWPLVLPGAKKEAADDDGKEGGKEGAVVKANKGMILRKSVEYIRYLQQLVTAHGPSTPHSTTHLAPNPLESKKNVYDPSIRHPFACIFYLCPSYPPATPTHAHPPYAYALSYLSAVYN